MVNPVLPEQEIEEKGPFKQISLTLNAVPRTRPPTAVPGNFAVT